MRTIRTGNTASSAQAAGDKVFRLRLDRATCVTEIPPRLFTHGNAYVVGLSCKCLTGGRAATFKGALIGIERWQDERVLNGMGINLHETGLDEERL
jgi:hypothetical protein